jgi:Glycosyltransferase family 87
VRSLTFAVIGIIAGGAIVIGAVGDWPTMRYRQDDFIEYWIASRALLDGVDPYDPAAYRALHDAVGSRGPADQTPGAGFRSPLLTAVATLPFALLPVGIAAPAWFVTQLLAAVAALVALTGRLFVTRPRRDLLLLLGLGVLMQPTFILSGDGNITHYLVGVVGGSLALMLRGQPFGAGLLLGLTAVKPQLFIIYVPALVLLASNRGRLRVIAGGAVSSGILLAVSLMLRPGWIGEWARQTLDLPSNVYGTATLWAVMPGELHGFAIAVAILSVVGLVVWQRTARPSLPVSAAAALSLSVFLAPYAYVGDQAVLLVAVVVYIALVAQFDSGMRTALLLALLATSSAWFLPWAAGLVPGGLELQLPAPALCLLLITTNFLAARRVRGARPGSGARRPPAAIAQFEGSGPSEPSDEGMVDRMLSTRSSYFGVDSRIRDLAVQVRPPA